MNTLLYKNKYRIPSARVPWWDYGANGRYFVTICTQNRECFFGMLGGINPRARIQRVKAVNICAGAQEIHFRCIRSSVLESDMLQFEVELHGTVIGVHYIHQMPSIL